MTLTLKEWDFYLAESWNIFSNIYDGVPISGQLLFIRSPRNSIAHQKLFGTQAPHCRVSEACPTSAGHRSPGAEFIARRRDNLSSAHFCNGC